MQEQKKLNPKVLTPPPEALKRMAEIEKQVIPKNKLFYYIKLFFTEGF